MWPRPIGCGPGTGRAEAREPAAGPGVIGPAGGGGLAEARLAVGGEGRRGAFLLQEPKRGSRGGKRAAPRGVSGSRRCREGTALTVPLRRPVVGRVSGAAALKPRGAGFPLPAAGAALP